MFSLPLLTCFAPQWLVDFFNQSIRFPFVRNFITDNRYMLFLQGIGNTLYITFGALIVGIVIGVAVAIIRVYYHQTGPFDFWKSLLYFVKTGRPVFLRQALLKVLDKFTNWYLALFRGTPVVVQLLLWSFVILPKFNSLLVAIIGFGINSGAYVSEIVRAGIMAVDKGQTEAGRSLGLSAAATMRFIVLPQAFKNVLPALSNELIALLKETSIVGYVAVMDITKAAQLVRARTFDAFFPLLAVAFFYLLCVMLLTVFQKKLEKSLQASDRK